MITLLTDFGTQDEFIGAMKGVIFSINSKAKLIDISHEIPPQSILSAQYVLNGYYAYYPEGTIHLVVVDPGVGTDRRIIGLQTDKHIFVAPDNGILTNIIKKESIKLVVEINQESFFREIISHTFHGRDKFAPIVANLSNGIALEKMGREIDFNRLITIENLPCINANNDQIVGEIIHIDRFGNLISNVSTDLLFKSQNNLDLNQLSVNIGRYEILVKNTYAATKKGNLIAVVNSQNHIEISKNGGSAAKQIKAEIGTEFSLKKG